MSDTYTLAARELPALQSLLSFQAQLAAGGGKSPDELCAKIAPLVDGYPTVTNKTVKAWYDQLMDRLHTTTTIEGYSFPVLHMLWHYQHFCFRTVVVAFKYDSQDADWTTFWHAFIKGKMVLFDGVGGIAPSAVPTIPDPYPYLGPFIFPKIKSWGEDDQAALQKWNDAPPSTLVANGVNMSMMKVCYPRANGGCDYLNDHVADGMPLYSQQGDIIKGWTGATQSATALADGLASSESSCYYDLLKPQRLDGQEYLFALHLLVGLLTGTSSATMSARDLLGSPCSSDEYPNDTFANLLVYSALLTLSDPLGSWASSNAKMQALLGDLQGLVTGADPGSSALRESLANHKKILAAEASYPVTDPYSTVTLPQRVSDTLAALDESRLAAAGPDD